MIPSLLDVNVLVSLFDPAHPNHNDAHEWLSAGRKNTWATCPIVINGAVRVLSNPAYPSIEATPAEVIARLQEFCSSPHHEFWLDDLSLLDARIFLPRSIAGHRNVTDVYLLALAVQRGGQLVTFDRSIAPKAVVGAEARHLKLLGSLRPSQN